MKKLFCLLTAFGLITLFKYSAPIKAEMPPITTPNRPDAIQEVTTQNREIRSDDTPVSNQEDEVTIQIQQQPNQVKQTQQTRTQAQVDITADHAPRLQRRFTFYYQRLTQIADKIENRFDKLEEQGTDVTEARAGFNNAVMLLEEAMEQAEVAISNFKNIDPEQDQLKQQTTLQVRNEAQQARQQFQQALILMRQSVIQAMSANE